MIILDQSEEDFLFIIAKKYVPFPNLRSVSATKKNAHTANRHIHNTYKFITCASKSCIIARSASRGGGSQSGCSHENHSMIGGEPARLAD